MSSLPLHRPTYSSIYRYGPHTRFTTIFHDILSRHWKILIAAIIITPIFWISIFSESETLKLAHKNPNDSSVDSILDTYQSSFLYSEDRDKSFSTIKLKPNIEVFNGIEIIWQEQNKLTTPIGIILFAHGCSHSAYDWWEGDECDNCVGLPEEIRIIKMSLNRGWIPITISSKDRDTGCWSLDDIQLVSQVFTAFMEKYPEYSNLPINAFGASSGGWFVSTLPGVIPNLKTINVQISTVAHHYTQYKKTLKQPATLFTHMSRDTTTSDAVLRSMRQIRHMHIRTSEIIIHPKKLVKNYFSDKMIGISPMLSNNIYTALLDEGYLDSNGYLLNDPRTTKWRETLKRVSDQFDLNENESRTYSLVADKSSISELLNVAYAYHEITSEYFGLVLDWFETKGEPNLLSVISPQHPLIFETRQDLKDHRTRVF